MLQVNEHYLKLQASYLFSDIAKRVAAFQAAHPEREVIKLGIGDVTNPLPPACIEAFHKAVDEMGTVAGFRGYGPEQGYDFLREAIAAHDFRARGALVEADEVILAMTVARAGDDGGEGHVEDGEGDDHGVLRKPREDRRAFVCQHLRRFRIRRFVGNLDVGYLDDLERAELGEAFLIFGDPVAQIAFLQFSDAQQRDGDHRSAFFARGWLFA